MNEQRDKKWYVVLWYPPKQNVDGPNGQTFDMPAQANVFAHDTEVEAEATCYRLMRDGLGNNENMAIVRGRA